MSGWRKGVFKENVIPSAHRNRGRTAWVDAHGPIPDGFHVHHKDGDFTNNRLDNLELVDAWLHNSMHHRGEEYEVPKHLRQRAKVTRSLYQKEWTRKNLEWKRERARAWREKNPKKLEQYNLARRIKWKMRDVLAIAEDGV